MNHYGVGLVAAVIICCFAPECGAADGDGPAVAPRPAAPTVLELILDLNSGKYTERQAATRALLERGEEAVLPLLEAAQGGNLEVAARAISIFETHYVGDEPRLADQAEAALEQLAESENQAASIRAAAVLRSHQDLREERAIAALERLGAVFKDGLSTPGFLNQQQLGEVHQRPLMLQFGSEWEGGDEGLKFVRRLSRVKTIYRIRGNGVSDDAWDALAQEMPEIRFQERGDAFLGISGGDELGGEGCRVGTVTPGAAADKAGLLPNDLIHRFGGKKVRDFEALIELIKEHSAGEQVEVDVLRNNQPMRIKVVLGQWR